MADNNKVITGAIAIIKDAEGTVIGKMRDIRINESYRRVKVPKGLGSIFDDEAALVHFDATMSCSYFEISYVRSGIKNAIRRNFGSNIISQIPNGSNEQNFEDQAVLDDIGIQVNIYKKVTDVVDENGLITPDAIPYALVTRCFLEGDNVNVSEGNIAGRDQTFVVLDPVITDDDFETQALA